MRWADCTLLEAARVAGMSALAPIAAGCTAPTPTRYSKTRVGSSECFPLPVNLETLVPQ